MRGLTARRAIGLFAVATAIGLAFAIQVRLVFTVLLGKPMPWSTAIVTGLVDWYLWAAFAPLVLCLVRRWPVGRALRARALGFHVAGAVGLSALHVVLGVTLGTLLGVWDQAGEWMALGSPKFWKGVLWVGEGRYHWNLVSYGALLFLWESREAWLRWRDRERLAARLEGRLAQERIESIERQLRPDFVFGTLDAIAARVAADPAGAERILSRLSDLLRLGLERRGSGTVSFSDDAAVLRAFLEVRRARNDRVATLVVEATEPACDSPVPPGLLLTLLEDWVVTKAPEAITVRAEKNADSSALVLQVRAAPGPDPGLEASLARIRERLARVYDGRARVDATAASGAQVFELVIPTEPSHAGEVSEATTFEESPARGLPDWAWAILGFAGVGLVFGLLRLGAAVRLQGPLPWRVLVGVPVVHWMGWLLLMPAVSAVARRFPLQSRLAPIAVHLGAGLAFAGAHLLLHRVLVASLAAAGFWEDGLSPAREGMWPLFVTRYHWDVVTYFGLLALISLRMFQRATAERERHAIALETHLTRARLEALDRQLQPHFLFNTLNGIAALIGEDAAQAARMVRRLRDLLSTTFERQGTPEVPLRSELSFLAGYLEIQQARFGERLTVQVDVDDRVQDALVPTLLLQPLVENALQHGVGTIPGPGWVHVRAIRSDTVLEIEVSDNGPGLAANGSETARPGLGLSHTRTRLQRLYGPHHRFDAGNGPAGGFVAHLAIPLRRTGTTA